MTVAVQKETVVISGKSFCRRKSVRQEGSRSRVTRSHCKKEGERDSSDQSYME